MNFSLVYGNNGRIENVVHGFANHNHDFLIVEALSFNLIPHSTCSTVGRGILMFWPICHWSIK